MYDCHLTNRLICSVPSLDSLSPSLHLPSLSLSLFRHRTNHLFLDLNLFLSLSLSLSLSLFLSLSIYLSLTLNSPTHIRQRASPRVHARTHTYIHTHTHTHTNIYIYIYIHRDREGEKEGNYQFLVRFLFSSSPPLSLSLYIYIYIYNFEKYLSFLFFSLNREIDILCFRHKAIEVNNINILCRQLKDHSPWKCLFKRIPVLPDIFILIFSHSFNPIITSLQTLCSFFLFCLPCLIFKFFLAFSISGDFIS